MIAFYLSMPDEGIIPSRDLTMTETLIMWGMVIFAFFVMPRLLFYFLKRGAHQPSATEPITQTEATSSSIDDDFADIAEQMRRERDNA